MSDQKRIIQGYEVTHAVQLAGGEVIFAVHPTEEMPYMVCDSKWNSTFGVDEYSNALVGDDPVEMLRIFTDRLSARMESIEAERAERGIPYESLNRADCDPKSVDMDMTGQVVVIKPEKLAPEYSSIDYQLAICTGGNGARPNAIGRSVFCTALYDDTKSRWDRSEIAGIILPERLPDWALDKLAALQKPAEKESVLGKLRKGVKTDVPRQPKRNTRGNDEPEL